MARSTNQRIATNPVTWPSIRDATYGRMWPTVKCWPQKAGGLSPRASNRLENAAQFHPILAASAHVMLEPMPRPTLAIPRLSLPVALLLCVGIVAVAEWVIHAMGHPLICKCGTVKIWYG